MATKTQNKVSGANSVVVTLNTPGTAKDRINVNEVITLAELGVDPSDNGSDGLTKPEFPRDLITDITEGEGDYEDFSPDEKAEAVQEAISEWREACKAFGDATGYSTLEERILNAVYQRLVDKHGFTMSDTQGKPYISKGEMVVTSFPVDGATLFSVVGTPVWGGK